MHKQSAACLGMSDFFHLVKIEGMFLRLLLQFVARHKSLLLLLDSARFLHYIKV